MNNYEEIVGIKTRFENSTDHELVEYLHSFNNKWILNNNKDITFFIKRAIENFGLNTNFTYEELNTNYKKCLYNVVYLQQSIINKNSTDDRFEEFQKIFNKIFESIDYSVKILKMGCIIVNSHSDENINIKDDLGLLRFLEPNIETNSPFQNLLLFLLDSIYTSGLQRYQCSLYEKIIYNGYFTHAWKEKMTIRSFIYDKTQYCIDYRQWHNLTSNAGNIKNATDFLENCQDPRITDLQKNRHVFAFKNGIYNCMEWDPKNKVYIDHFYEYGSDLVHSLDINVVASKFFNMEFNNFDELDDWYNIPTPNFQSIFDYQGFDQEVSRWLYVFVGRLFFNLGELDNWQVALFLEGVAGSGKSTITKLVKKFYETCDVGVLSNNIEKKFGLSSLKDKLLYLAPEIKGDLCLEQSEFQLLIEGGDMQLPEKYKESAYIEWKTPGLFAGNEPPNYTDNSGSISRRLVVAKFHKKVTDKDSDLDNKLNTELPSIMKKSACAYLSAVTQFKGKDFWSSLPKYFRDTQQDMAQNTHSLEHFISSGKLVLGKGYYCRERTFVEAFNDHCKECNLERHKFTTDYYLGVFGNYDLNVQKNLKLKYPNNNQGKIYQTSFIMGIDLINEIAEEESFD
uniref:SF3 helicase domain-containing protein n=1 Tax=viral metagenome TaxID=1070528 RepID=A0A6C0I9N9_9ZZZZ